VTESLSDRSDLLLRLEWIERAEAHRAELDLDAARGVLRVGDRLEEVAARTLGKPGPRPKDQEPELLRSLLAGFPDRVGKRRDPRSDRAVLVGGRGAKLAKESVVKEPMLFLALEVDDTRRSGDAGGAESLIRIASAIEPEWLSTEESVRVRWNAGREAVEAVAETRYRDLVLGERVVQEAPAEEIAAALADAAEKDLDRALPALRSDEFVDFAARVELLRREMPELDLAPVDRVGIATLLPKLCLGLRSFADLGRIDLVSVVRQELGFRTASALDKHAPERLPVPSGSTIRLRYDPMGGAPFLSVRLQEVFGMLETPRVANGRVPVKMELLAPNHRPVQVTQDLRSFWANTYPEVRRELRARYPKHAWPDDPWTAKPERKPQRRR
jgi:ATP-dependent helicase HrpB